MVDAYTLAEKKEIMDVLKNKIMSAKGSDRAIYNKPVSEIKNELYSLIKEGKTLPYFIKKKTVDDVLSRISSTVNINALDFSNSRDRKTYEDYIRKSDAVKEDIHRLETGLSNIIDEFLEKEVNPIVNLSETYHKIASVEHPIANIDKWLDEKTRDTLKENEVIRDLKEKTHINELTNHYLTERIAALMNGGILPPNFKRIGGLDLEHLKTYLFHANESKRAEVQKLIELASTSRLADLAKSKFESKLKDNEKKIGEENAAYESIKKGLDDTFSAEDTRLIDDFNTVATEYGRAILSNNAGAAEKIRSEASYGKIRNAIVKNEAHEMEIDYHGHAFRLDELYVGVVESVKRGLSKSDANKILTEIKGRVGTIKRRVDGNLDDVLTSIYKNVLAGSELDTTSLGKKKKYMIIHGDRFAEKWDETANGIHAEAGLGWYFNEFIGDEVDVLEKPGYLERIKHAGKRLWGWIAGNAAAPLADRTVRRRKHGGAVNRLQSKIITRHKHAAYHDISEKNAISIDDLVKLGLGLSVKENGEEDIISKWAKVRQLNSASSMDEILETYMEAAELGESINEDAKHRTRIEDRQFEWLDNYINKKSGFSYYMKDKAVDWANGIFNRAGLGKEIDLEDSEGWSIHQTALKPNLYPFPIMALTGLAALVGGYAFLHSKITGETVDKKKSAVFSLYEIAKEALIAFGAAKFVKGSEAPKPEAAPSKKKVAESHAPKEEKPHKPAETHHEEKKPERHEIGKKEIHVPKGGTVKEREGMVCIEDGSSAVCIPKQNLSEKTKKEHGIKD